MSGSAIISSRLKALREERGISVAELADSSGVSQPYIWQMEKLSSGLGVNVEELLTEPKSASDTGHEELPPSLSDFLREKGDELGVRQGDIEMLPHIRYRGRVPKTVKDWELIFVFLQRMLDR